VNFREETYLLQTRTIKPKWLILVCKERNHLLFLLQRFSRLKVPCFEQHSLTNQINLILKGKRQPIVPIFRLILRLAQMGIAFTPTDWLICGVRSTAFKTSTSQRWKSATWQLCLNNLLRWEEKSELPLKRT